MFILGRYYSNIKQSMASNRETVDSPAGSKNGRHQIIFNIFELLLSISAKNKLNKIKQKGSAENFMLSASGLLSCSVIVDPSDHPSGGWLLNFSFLETLPNPRGEP